MTFRELQHRLRARSEYALRLAAMDEVGRRYSGRVSKPALPRVGLFWRFVFVPVFQRVPWSFKQKAMRTFKMTAVGWPADARRFGEPWRPPARADRPTTPEPTPEATPEPTPEATPDATPEATSQPAPEATSQLAQKADGTGG